MSGKTIRLTGFLLVLITATVFCRVGLGQTTQTAELKDIQVTALKNGIHFHVVLPDNQDLVQANLEYWNGKIFDDAQKLKTNLSYPIKANQHVLDFDIKDDPRIELNKAYLSFVLYFHFRLQDKEGNLLDTPDMVYYIQRTWYVQPAGSMVFFAQRRSAYWDRLPEIGKTITGTVDQLYGLKQKKVFVLLYKNGYDLSHDTGMPGWAAALFMYNIWMKDYNTETRFVAEMAHEYTHYLQFENESRIPLFFMEGMSDYTYFHLAPKERPDLSLYKTYMDKKLFLDSNQMFGQYPQETKYIESFYKQAYLFVQYIADQLGPEKFKKFIHELSDKALDQVVADTPEFAKKGIYGMWMEIHDQVAAAPSRPRFMVDGKYPPAVTQINEGWKDIWGLSFSADSKKAAVGKMILDKSGKPTSIRLEIVDIADGKTERSREIKFIPSGLRWSPTDPDRFMTFVPQDDGTKIGLFSWKDRDYKVIGGENENIDDARYSPDGKSIGFVSDHSGASELYIMNADGSGEKQITRGIGYIASFNWLPDGKGFLVSVNSGGDDLLVRLSAPDYKPEALPNAGFYRVNGLQLSPDGGKIVYFANSSDFSESNLVILDLASGVTTQLTHGANVDFVRWTDDQTLLFGAYDENEEKTVVLRYDLQAAHPEEVKK